MATGSLSRPDGPDSGTRDCHEWRESAIFQSCPARRIQPYRLPLRGLPELADLDASVILREPAPGKPGVSTSVATTTQQTQVIELRKQQWTPDQDLEVRSKTAEHRHD